MYLKQIELENFKSFGGKLTVPLMEGYIAVTGPNGSGKSNISDAILFVLGPRSSKAIRAGKLSDLIFDGGKSKSPANYTKVSLVFDNSDRLIPWDADTVRLTRLVRMSQSGEGYNSYFYVNDIKSSLTEFDNLLSSARISAEGYNLVQQGDVTRIVEMGNIERRKILENISGISRFDGEIEKAQMEREEAEENIERISIIIEELRKQIGQLEEEREVALEYMKVRSRLEMSKAQLSHRNRESALAEAVSIEQQTKLYGKEIEDLIVMRDGQSEEISSLERSLRDLEREIESKGGPEYQKLKEDMNAARVDLARFKDRAERALDDLEEALAEIKERKETSEDNASRMSALRGSIDETEGRIGVLRDRRSGDAEALDALKAQIESRGGQIAEIQSGIDSLEGEISSLESKEREEEINDSRNRVRLEELEFQMASLEESLQTAEFELGDAEWNLRETKSGEGSTGKRMQDLSAQFHERKRELDGLEEESGELDQAIRRLQRDLESLRAQKSAAENLEKGYNRAVSAILDLRDSRSLSGIHGTIAELAEVDKDYETALNVAAGGRMQAVVVEDDDVASEAIAYLKKNRLGRVMFLPLNKMRDGRPRAKAIMVEKECIGYAIDLISFDPRFRPAFWHVLSDTLVVKDLDQARSIMGGIRLVTLAGEVLETSGAMIGGTLSQANVRFGAAAQGRLESVADELGRANEADIALRERIKALRTEIKTIEDEIRSLQGSNESALSAVRQMERDRDGWKEKRDGLRNELQDKKDGWSVAKEEEARIRERLTGIRSSLREKRESLDERRQEMAGLAPEGVQKEMEELRQSVSSLDSEISGLEGDLKGLRAELSAASERSTEIEGDIHGLEEECIALRASHEENVRLQDGKEVELRALRKIEESMEGEVRELRARRDSVYQSKVGAEGERSQTEERIETKRDFLAGLQAKAAVAKEKVSQYDEEISLIEIEVERPLPSAEELRRTIRNAENRLTQMGAVNLRAIEDYETKSDRHRRFMDEVSRLEGQRGELLVLMESLEAEKRTIFMQVFASVDGNFRNVYAELSGGGEAYLSLENEDAPFEGGMLIKAKPKNGKMLRLEALSGGEKSLTALAFIFAIQEYQPSPFYLLDEVDMFLDSVNAEMVAKRVQKSAVKAQFVQISLRKVTLGKAEHLFGVTRQPNGVSKIIIQPDMAAMGGREGPLSTDEVKT